MAEEEISLMEGYEPKPKTAEKVEKKKTIGELKSKEFKPLEVFCDNPSRLSTAGKDVVFDVVVRNPNPESIEAHMKINLIYSNPPEKGGPEWPVSVQIGDEEFSVQQGSGFDFTVGAESDIKMKIIVHTPKGVFYGDILDTSLIVHPSDDPLSSNSLTLRVVAKQSVFAVKTTIGQEREVAEVIASRAKARNAGVFSILCPANLRGYVLVEAMNVDRLREIVRGIRRAKGVVEGETSIAEIEHYLTPKPAVAEINEGDIVELISGPFKGEKARVLRIDEAKEEITVELFEAMVPIPVTVRADSVKVLEKEEEK